MNWLSLADDSGGLGLFADDHGDLDIGSLTVKDVRGVRTSFVIYGQQQHAPPVYLAVHAGDWHHVADLYRVNVAARDPRPKNSAWAQDCDAWGAELGNSIENGYCFIPDFYTRQAAPQGIRLLDVYRAMFDGPWCYCGVYPYPNPFYGTPEELREANQRVRDHGGRMIYYINYMLTIPDGPKVKRIGPAAKALLPANVPLPYNSPERKPLQGTSVTGYPDWQYGADRSSRAWRRS